ncbi:enoyl-CoA hydratase/isomerase family protein [Salinadaptatus halalkaliphilus]|nr:enoyl-CoA hydratase/isomerase family protein [Salinadaptatus halalkaliphilus]
MPTAIDYTIETDRAIAFVTLDRPDALNALNDRLIEEFCETIERAESDDDVRVIVVQGQGDDAFSAGYDINPEGETEDPVPSVEDLLDRFDASTAHVHAVWDCDKPVIAAVDGYCLAGGSDLAMACDIVIATDDSSFGYPGLRMAGVPPTLIYPFVMNLHEAKELLLSGKIVDAERADELGMVNRVVAKSELMDAVFAEVEELRKMPGNNVRILKHVLNGTAEMKGASPMFKYSELFDALGHHTEYGKEYYRIAATEGFDAALEYMNDIDKGMTPSE